MSRVITFSRKFQAGHPRAGQPTHFVESICRSLPFEVTYKMICDLNPGKPKSLLSKFWKSIDHKILSEYCKYHTVRAGQRYKAGDTFSPRVWANNPYHSKQIIIAPDIRIEKVFHFETLDVNGPLFFINHRLFVNASLTHYDFVALERLSHNDGLDRRDFINWFPKPMEGQIICWKKYIDYLTL